MQKTERKEEVIDKERLLDAAYLCIKKHLSTSLHHGARNKKKRLPPGPRGFPIFGSLHLLSGEFPNKDLHRLARKYGDIMYMRLGLMPTIVVSSPQAAKLFLKTHDLVFASRPPHEGAKHISFWAEELELR
ncbi:cytochrome P450 CYP736A12-like [Prunus yedoensis var. nudiflora]|uniref:Cytochrome P450 CYP736A12-like n=1 Tax=Prunus yedoensis var. nudiflora TaxID=2094558 RepID=A0A314YJI5_PRUYE|nr:cytochrome P450 CYP736A12-like [Prunus yedoensis var. nudiflora]